MAPLGASMASNRFPVGVLLAAIAVTLFGGSLPATRLAVSELDPWFVTAARGAIAGLVAAASLAALRRPVPRQDMPTLLLVAFCLVLGFPGLMAVAMASVPSAHGGVVLGLLPLATAVSAVFVAGERPSSLFWAMSVLGAALVVAFSMREGWTMPTAGDLLLFAAVAICGFGYAVSGTLSRRMPGWEVISWAVVISLPVFLPAAILLWPADAAAVTAPAWAGLAYVGLIAQYLGFFLWNSALAMGGVARVGQVQLLQPFATLAIAALLLDESVDGRTLLFALAVVGTVAAGLRARIGFRPHAAAPLRSAPAERRPAGR